MTTPVSQVAGGRYAIVRGSGADGGLSSVYEATGRAQDTAPVALRIIGWPQSPDERERPRVTTYAEP